MERVFLLMILVIPFLRRGGDDIADIPTLRLDDELIQDHVASNGLAVLCEQRIRESQNGPCDTALNVSWD